MNDQEESWSSRGAETIRGLLKEWELAEKNGNGIMDPASPLQSEYLAEIAAYELLYPQEYRQADIEKLKTGSTSLAKIALEHEAPAYAIGQALENHEIFCVCWEMLKAD